MKTGTKAIIWIIVIAIIVWLGYEVLKPPASAQTNAQTNTQNSAAVEESSAPMVPSTATTTPFSTPVPDAKG